MKIPSIDNIKEVSQVVKKTLPDVVEKITEKVVPQSALECSASYSKAFINDPNHLIAPEVKKIFQDLPYFLKRPHVARDGFVRIIAGRPVEGSVGICDSSVQIFQKNDIAKKLNKIFVKDDNEKTVRLYDSNGVLKKFFSKEDMQALYYYKYHPQYIHYWLRKGMKACSGKEFEELQTVISRLDKIFSENKLTSQIKNPRFLYRAMNIHTKQMGNLGDIYQDNSFVSTTRDYLVAKQFRADGRPIMKIEVPRGAKYVNLDDLFNIDFVHWTEKEYLLPRGSKFEIKDIDKSNNIVTTKLII